MPVNSHYIPKLTLRKFGDKLCIYNVKAGELKENTKLEKSFNQFGFYSDEIEEMLNKKCEAQFANLFSNYLMKESDEIRIKRKDLLIIKKFLLISVLRSIDSDKVLQKEKRFYDELAEKFVNFGKANGWSDLKIQAYTPQPPFKEIIIIGESAKQYWERTLKVILETDGTPQEVLKHPLRTIAAYRWASVIYVGYLGFWDSEYINDEFVITDIGMTSENEVGWDGIYNHNLKKTITLLDLLKNNKVKEDEPMILNSLMGLKYLHENFMMFPISSKRMIVLISPFYKTRIQFYNDYSFPPLSYYTCMENENLYFPNNCEYVLKQDQGIKHHPDDIYVYNIKKLTKKETQYCNVLFLDRTHNNLGFSSLDKVKASLEEYRKVQGPRVDYSNLYKIMDKRYN